MPGLHAPVICVMGDVDVAYVANHWMLESEEIQANARLIAASPDLRQVAELAAMERWPRAHGPKSQQAERDLPNADALNKNT